MDLLPDAEQEQIADSVAAFLRAQAPAARLLERDRPHASAERGLWPRYAALGWFGMGLAEDLGGVGYGPAEEALLYREIGRTLASPNILAARLAAEVAGRTGQPDVGQSLLAGDITAAVANPTGRCRLGPRCSGRFQVLDADPDGRVVAWNDDGVAVLQLNQFKIVRSIPSLDAGVSLAVGELEDATPSAWISAQEAPLPAFAMVMVAAMACGVAEAAAASALDYVKFRQQFGRPIGSFQAIKHHCANMALANEAAWAQTVMATLSLDDDTATRNFETAAAKFVSTEAANLCAALNVQLHGGLGYAAECDAHLYVKRARLLEQLGGARRAHRDKLMSFPMTA